MTRTIFMGSILLSVRFPLAANVREDGDLVQMGALPSYLRVFDSLGTADCVLFFRT